MLPPATKTLNNQPFVLVSEGPLKSFELYHTFAKPWKMRENTNVTRNWEAMLRHIASYSRLRQKWQKTPPQPRSTLRKYNTWNMNVFLLFCVSKGGAWRATNSKTPMFFTNCLEKRAMHHLCCASWVPNGAKKCNSNGIHCHRGQGGSWEDHIAEMAFDNRWFAAWP